MGEYGGWRLADGLLGNACQPLVEVCVSVLTVGRPYVAALGVVPAGM